MQNSFQTSFIPKRPINSTNTFKKESKSIFSILSVLLLIVVVVSSIGLFFYKKYLVNQKEILSSSLLKVRKSFQKDTINKLELFDKRINTAKDILSNHIVLSPTFKLLGDLTVPYIQYTKFTQSIEDGVFHIKLSGISRDYTSIALQAGIFNGDDGKFFSNIIFSNLNKDKNNYVTFNVEFDVDNTLLSYKKNFDINSSKVNEKDLSGNLNNN